MDEMRAFMQVLAEDVATHLPGEWTVTLFPEGSSLGAHLVEHGSQSILFMKESLDDDDRDKSKLIVGIEPMSRSTAHRPVIKVLTTMSGKRIAESIEARLPGIRWIRDHRPIESRPLLRPGDPAIRSASGHVVGLRGSQQLYGADLQDQDLSLIDFRRADLRFANLRGARLIGCDMTGADMTGSHLTDADFSFAKVVLPKGWELVEGRAHVRSNWHFDQKGRAFFQDRDKKARRLAALYDD
jgi:hypothetical protein